MLFRTKIINIKVLTFINHNNTDNIVDKKKQDEISLLIKLLDEKLRSNVVHWIEKHSQMFTIGSTDWFEMSLH